MKFRPTEKSQLPEESGVTSLVELAVVNAVTVTVMAVLLLAASFDDRRYVTPCGCCCSSSW